MVDVRLRSGTFNGAGNVRRLDVPSTQVEFDHGHKSLNRIINSAHGEESIGVGHEARRDVSSCRAKRQGSKAGAISSYLVIRSSMDRGSRMNVGRTTRLKSAPGRSWEMMCDRTGSCQWSF